MSEADRITERSWLAEGLRQGLVRPETAVKIMEIIDAESDETQSKVKVCLDGAVVDGNLLTRLRENDHS